LVPLDKKLQNNRSFDRKGSFYLYCLFSDLQDKLKEKLSNLNKKLFVWMESTPISHVKAKKKLRTDRVIIKNTILEEFNKNSFRRKTYALKLKFNR